MRVGVPAEVKDHEQRVGMTPEGVHTLYEAGHTVIVERGAGAGAGFPDELYEEAGAQLGTAADAWACELVVKVKEPTPDEYKFLHENLTLFCYLHLAAEPELAEALKTAGTTAIAFETVTGPQGGLPLLTPMSEIAGRLSVQIGAQLLTNPEGGPGVLLGGISGVAPVNVTVIGGGISGAQAVDVAVGLGAQVTVLDINTTTLRRFMERYKGRVHCVSSSPTTIAEALSRSHMVIGAVLVPGARAPRVVTAKHLEAMRPGSVFVDIAIDQGGCTEVSRPTSHSNPTFQHGNVTMYCVTNMPGSAQVTATKALSAETLPFVQQLANLGTEQALAANPHLAAGVNIAGGEIVHEGVRQALC
ncbi:alanine dehydrogenase [Corynebacterium sp.]|uniref:alanine dehydrogenase n=1 Tax=Corynebacterium sp. TaxID=1720 RepID=UPI0026DAD409|nr:alanine dehydrogenase [Corynebacterium sp.]MDO5077452.1 alanine dehydrogenase [Corynebacterium sp.]